MVDHALLAVLVFTFGIGLLFVVLLARLRIPGIVALMLAGWGVLAEGPFLAPAEIAAVIPCRPLRLVSMSSPR